MPCDLMAKAGFYCRVFLDDFVGVTTAAHVDVEVAHLRSLLASFGLAENVRKFVAPANDIVILGVQFVFSQGRAWVSSTRVHPVVAQLDHALRGKTVQSAALRKLCGVLSFIAAVVPWGTGPHLPVVARAGYGGRGHAPLQCVR